MAKINPIQLQKHLKGVNYPASKQDLVDAAGKNGADDDVRAALDALPDEEYQTPAEVSQALGGHEDGGNDRDGDKGDKDDRRNADRDHKGSQRGDHAKGGERGQDDGDNGDGGEKRINPIQLQKHLKGVDYPASKQDLLDAAGKNGADDEVRAALDALPDEEYQTPADVSQALGGRNGDDRKGDRK
ncbi:hypothetical protein Dcar01_02852 [Deinococcus carri]|uniref:DUF2795 domain-containing protein n=1 Tax=Deinococcus carri TaxID=1211323 RepID=A0ABP9WCB1_9DEIO